MVDLGVLRDVENDELELMLSWRNEPPVRRNMYTREEIALDRHLTWWSAVSKSDKDRYFMYEYKGAPSGIVGFTSIDGVNSNCSWAFYSAPDAPKGSGSRMEYLALEFAFYELGLHKVNCEVLSFNTVVINLHKKFGFSIEGIFRAHHLYNEKYIDIYRLGILKNEWEARRVEIYGKLAGFRGRQE